MTCHDAGTLQAYLDGEVSLEEKKRITKHVEKCQACRETLDELKALDLFIEHAMEEQKAAVNTDRAWAAFGHKLQTAGSRGTTESKKSAIRKGWHSMNAKTKRYLLSGVAAAAIFSSFAIPQVQVGASQFLSLFRVDQFEMVQLTQNDLNEIEQWMNENEAGEIDLKGLGKLERSAVAEVQYFETAEAAGAAGYQVPQLSDFTAAGVHVMPASDITFTLNVEKANQLLEQLGADQQFEAVLDGKPFSVSISETLQADYQLNGQYLSYVRTTSPEVSLPEGASVAELRDTLLSLPFWPENVKKQLAAIEDLENTLPVPAINTAEAQVNEVRVGGSEGFTMESGQESSVVWKEGETIHMLVSGAGMTAEELTGLAADIK